MEENDFICSIISLEARESEIPRTIVNYKGEVINNLKDISYNLIFLIVFSVLSHLLFSPK